MATFPTLPGLYQQIMAALAPSTVAAAPPSGAAMVANAFGGASPSPTTPRATRPAPAVTPSVPLAGVPQGRVEAPPTGPSGAMSRLWSMIQNDPRAMMYLLTAGARMSGPRQQGESQLQHITGALSQGLEGIAAYNAVLESRRERERKAGLEEREVGVKEKQATSQAKAVENEATYQAGMLSEKKEENKIRKGESAAANARFMEEMAVRQRDYEASRAHYTLLEKQFEASQQAQVEAKQKEALEARRRSVLEQAQLDIAKKRLEIDRLQALNTVAGDQSAIQLMNVMYDHLDRATQNMIMASTMGPEELSKMEAKLSQGSEQIQQMVKDMQERQGKVLEAITGKSVTQPKGEPKPQAAPVQGAPSTPAPNPLNRTGDLVGEGGKPPSGTPAPASKPQAAAPAGIKRLPDGTIEMNGWIWKANPATKQWDPVRKVAAGEPMNIPTPLT